MSINRTIKFLLNRNCIVSRSFARNTRSSLPFFAQNIKTEFNEDIKDEKILLVYPPELSKKKAEITTKKFAMEESLRLDLDLVKTSMAKDAAVCKLMDFRAHLIEKSLNEKKTKDKKQKEIKLKTLIKEHDLDIKINKAKELLESGYPVRINVEVKLEIRKKQLTSYYSYINDYTYRMEREYRASGKQGDFEVDVDSIPLDDNMKLVKINIDEKTDYGYEMIDKFEKELKSVGVATAPVNVNDFTMTIDFTPKNK